MSRFILKRILISSIILFFVVFIIYLIMRMLPTSFIETVAQEMTSRPGNLKSKDDWLRELNALYGGNQNIVQGFFQWIGQALKGNFGDSWYYAGFSVTGKFRTVIWNSFYLGFAAFVLQMVIAIPLGIIAAKKQYSAADYSITVISLIGISIPTFFVATLLKLAFSIELGWFDISGMRSRDYVFMDSVGQFFDIAKHFVLPIMTLTIISIGGMMRYTRTNMLEVLSSDYIRMARAKGLSERRVVYHHAFRNTLIPIVTIMGGSLPGLFSGALITETLFKIDGIGYTSFTAMTSGDIPFTMFYMSFMAILTLLGTLIADIMYAVVDPRVRIS